MTFIIRSASNDLESDYFKAKYGTLTEGVNTGSIVGKYWNVIVLVRWSVTIIILVVLRDIPEWQIMYLLMVSVFF